MFTGIIEEVGKIKSVRKERHSAVLSVAAKKALEDVQVGDSIAVNGVCLTVTGFGDQEFTADVMHETMNRSSLGNLKIGDDVNLERAMRLGGRFGGHIVSGHIDGTAEIADIKKDENAVWYTLRAEPEILRYIVEKGSVAVDGISLTVAFVTDREFGVSVIPHTRTVTALGKKRIGEVVNIENDCIGKYVEKLLGFPGETPYDAGTSKKADASTLTKEKLLSLGFY